MSQKLWGGRFEIDTHPEVEAFTTSFSVDRRLWKADLQASSAQAAALGRAGVLTPQETTKMVEGLSAVWEKMDRGTAALDENAEDIHSEIERLLNEEIGALSGKLHTGRSRNDQVATATRLYARGQIDGLLEELKSLKRFVIERAEGHLTDLLPGLTHLQHAQPVSLAHHLMAYFWMWERDTERLREARRRLNALPLGSGALAGTPYAIDRAAIAKDLGFDSLCENSLDAVSDRDFVVETISALALLMSHFSRLADEIIRWNTPEVGFVELSDAVTTGSSLMPQKKNPDVAELLRAKSGRVVGSLVGMLTVLKALPLSYNRDLQEDKAHFFEALDTAKASLRAMRVLLEGTRFKTETMRASLEGDYSNATELADFLVKKGLPFRQAHEVVGKIVQESLKMGVPLEKLDEGVLARFSSLLDASVKEALRPESAVAARSARGGTAVSAVKEQIRLAKERV